MDLTDSTLFVTDTGASFTGCLEAPIRPGIKEQEPLWPNTLLLISQLMNLYLLIPNWPMVMPVKEPLQANPWPLGTIEGKQSGQC